jgi:hypothetical protein
MRDIFDRVDAAEPSDETILGLYHGDATSAFSFSVSAFNFHFGREVIVQVDVETVDSIYRYYWRSVWLYNLLFPSHCWRIFVSNCRAILSRIIRHSPPTL